MASNNGSAQATIKRRVRSSTAPSASNDGQAKAKSSPKPVYRASLTPDPPIPDAMGSALATVQQLLGTPVLLYLQSNRDNSRLGQVCDDVYELFASAVLPKRAVTLIVHSLGGYADSAYQTVNAIRNRCGRFDVLIPDQAKSAATLLAMGGHTVRMRALAHLGPIDPQIFDFDSHVSSVR